jgi:hypothetical protein
MRSLALVSILQHLAAAKIANALHLRDFRSPTIFEFFNTIRQKRPLAECGKVVLDWLIAMASRHRAPPSLTGVRPLPKIFKNTSAGAILADALEKAAAGKPHKLALVASLQPSLIVGRNGCRLIAQTLHGHRNAICWVTQAGARHKNASRVPLSRGHVLQQAVPERYAISRRLWQNCR